MDRGERAGEGMPSVLRQRHWMEHERSVCWGRGLQLGATGVLGEWEAAWDSAEGEG